jgi:hypothetical protein
MLAAQAAAVARADGKPDPLESAEKITPALLAKLGVSENAQHTALAKKYLWRIHNMLDGDPKSITPATLTDWLNSIEWRVADRRVIADFHLLAARIFWRQNRFGKSILAIGHAAMIRPAILARPLKQSSGISAALRRQRRSTGSCSNECNRQA